MYQVFNSRYPLNPRQKILFIYFNLRLSDSNLVCEVVPIDACRFPKRSVSVAEWMPTFFLLPYRLFTDRLKAVFFSL